MKIVCRILAFLRFEKPCKDGYGHSWEYDWGMQPCFCRVCHLRYDNRFDREEK